MTSASGPVMIVATDILRVPRARVGKLFGNVTLPRSVELRSVGAAGAGALLGVFLWVMPIGLITSYSTSSLFYTMAALGTAGVATLYVQPMKGEPLWRWMLLTFQNSGRARRSGRVYLGTHQLSRVAAGPVRII